MLRPVRLPSLAAMLVLLSVVPLAPAQQPPAPPSPAPPPPAEAELEEKVTVRLAEVQILVTDRDGNPITDLKPAEIEIREDGDVRKVAYLEPFATVGALSKSMRWIVLLFDVLNSRTMDRKHWVAAARRWVQTDMRSEDRVSLAVLESQGTVRELVPFTGDRELLAHALAEDTLLDGYPHQDYTNDMRRIVEDLNETCGQSKYPEGCIDGATEPLTFEWRGRGEQTLRGLQQLAGSLGAIPGRKAILFLGPGIVPDPGLTAGNAALAVFGTDRLGVNSTITKRDNSLNQQLLEMTRIAASADVSFFTMDSRPSSLRDQSTDVEQSDGMAERRLFDPFQQIFDATRGSLDTIAIRTGGRSLHGPALDKNLPILARSVEGIYSLGFYRDPDASRKPTVKVKVARRGAVVTFPDRYDSRRDEPLTIPVEVAIGKTEGLAGGILVPVVIQARASALTFSEEEGQDVARVSVYAEAITPEGKREASAYQQVEVRLDVSRRGDRPRLAFSHDVPLVLPPGGYRIRVRLSESSFKKASDRSVDITLNGDGTVTPGIQKSVQIQGSGRTEPPQATGEQPR
ncbi:MAG: VWA domain-containing protein [Acidobacteria bacterium]|nr:VWA domain-containing protein [Acidobacteriota bacterium]